MKFNLAEFGKRIKQGVEDAGERTADRFIEATEKAKAERVENAILDANPNKVIDLLTQQYEQKRRREKGEELKNEPNKEKRGKELENLEKGLERRRRREENIKRDEERQREELKESLQEDKKKSREELENSEEYKMASQSNKRELRRQFESNWRQKREGEKRKLEEGLEKKREGEKKISWQMTLIKGPSDSKEEEHPRGYAEREILRRRAEEIVNAGAIISDSEYLDREKKRQEKLNELYKKKSEEAETLSGQEKKDIEAEIESLKKEVEKEMLKVARALDAANLKKVEDVIDDFVDKDVRQEAGLSGKYQPIEGFKWSGGEVDAWKKQVREVLNHKYKIMATELRNTKKWYEEAKFDKVPREISIEPKKPTDEKMRRDKVRREYGEKKEWVDLRADEYAKSQKIILKNLERIRERMRVSLENDPEVRNLATFFRRNPDAFHDWLKIKEAVKYQKDIEKSFQLEIGEQRSIQTLKNTLKQDLQDILYRNFIDMFRGVIGPFGNVFKHGILAGGGKEVGKFFWNFISGGAEFFLKETLVSPTRLGLKLGWGGIGALEKGARKGRKNEKIRMMIKKGINK